MQKNLLLSTISLLFLLLNINTSVSGVTGTQVWNDESYIIYDTNLKIIYNHDLDPFAPPNVDVSGAEITIRYDGLNNEEKMVFFTSTSNNFLSNFMFGGGVVNNTVDPKSSLTENDNPTFRFSSTEGFQDGFETIFQEDFTYLDDFSGLHSESVKYKVIGDKFEFSINVDNIEKTISSWNLQIDHEINYVNLGFEVQEKNLFSFTMTDGNGVQIQTKVKTEINIKLPEDTTFESLFYFEFTMDAIRSNGVKLNSEGVESDSGFLPLIGPWTIIISFTVLITLYRKLKL